MTFEEIYSDQDCEVYLNGNPVWDYKLTGNQLKLISFEIEDKEDTVTVQELADYIIDEELTYDTVDLVNEETDQPVVDFIFKYNVLHLSNLILE